MTTKDEQPTQQEICGGCKGSGWVTRDPDIGTDQECFVCEGKGTVEPEHPAQQEPVAWIYSHGKAKVVSVNYVPGVRATPLYASPPAQRTWAGLTNEGINALLGQFPHYSSEWDEFDFYVLARAIEAELKEKNT